MSDITTTQTNATNETNGTNATFDLNGINWTNAVWTDNPDNADKPLFVPTVDESVVSAYRAANQTEKARIRTTLTKFAQDYIRDMEPIPARNVQATLDALSGQKAEKEQVHPFVTIASRVANLLEAANLLATGQIVPDGLNTDELDYADFMDYLDKADVDDEAAESIAKRRIGRNADKHSIQEVVDRAFEGCESGAWLTIAQIARRGATADYMPGSGAIAAALFKSGGTPIKGVTPTQMTADRPRGAMKD